MTTTLRLLERLGCRPVPLDRSAGQDPFALGGWSASCPRCSRFAGALVEPDGSRWRSSCGCFGPRLLDELDLLLLVRRIA